MRIKNLYKMEINIKNLIGKVEIHYHGNEPQEVLGLSEKITEILGNAVADISQVPSREKELDRLKYHEATTVGLWVIDRNPKEVSYEWIKENAYQIKPTSICPEYKS